MQVGLFFTTKKEGHMDTETTALIKRIKALEEELAEANNRVREAERLACITPLTGLLNRRGLLEEVHTELERAKRDLKPLSLLFFDIDKFKKFNDKFGHDAGDQAIKKLGQFLKKHLRKSDVVTNPHGDEFVVILPGKDIHQAERLARKTQEALDKAYFIILMPNGKKERVSIKGSIGAASTSEGFTTFTQLSAAADRQMYADKKIRSEK